MLKEIEHMYIAVDLSPRDEASMESTDSEALLCSISYDPRRECLTLSPDFSEEECYSIEGIGMSYDYWITDASLKPTTRELLRRRERIKKVKSRTRFTNLLPIQLYSKSSSTRSTTCRLTILISHRDQPLL
jgi:hypothetical protein